MRAALAALLATLVPAAAAAAPGDPVVLDNFENPGLWSVQASEDVKAVLRTAPGTEGLALCLDFDFGAVSGYAVARRALDLGFPENFELTFDIRGDAPPNTLELKLVDASAENVWWNRRADFEFPREWRAARVRKREIEFAWGPTTQRALRGSAAIELVVAKGRGGGSGSVCFDQLNLRELPSPAAARPIAASASSTLAESPPEQALDGSRSTAWRSDPAAGAEQTFTLDLGGAREFGGLVLRWLPGSHASRYTIETSDDAGAWRIVREVVAGNGGMDPILLPESEARYLRLRLHEGPSRGYGLAEIEIKDLEFGKSPNAFFEALARQAPRGHYPRGFAGEQAYWTVVGIDGGLVQALLSEDGALEIAPGAPAVEPMLVTGDGLLTWADATIEHRLREGYLPMPTVVWRSNDLALRIDAFGEGERARSQLVARYTIENRSSRARMVTLVLAVRPFQVNPPAQFLNLGGGVAPIHALKWDGRALSLDGRKRLFPLTPPFEVLVAPFDAGNLPELLSATSRPAAHSTEDATGFASGALLFRLDLPAHGARSIGLVAPWSGAVQLPPKAVESWMRARESDAAAAWRAKLNRVIVRTPGAGRAWFDTLRTALGHILVNRAGAALQPGARSYARSWIRDGALSSEALLRLGHESVVRDFADWYAPHQFANGKIPCCVDHRGADPVAEHDSQGEWIHLVGELYRHAGDPAWLRTMWPGVRRAAAYMESLRVKAPGSAFHGLMPPSISHEGYSDKPAYSYWDDFWVLAGYRSAVEVARALGRGEDAETLAAQGGEFQRDVLTSIDASVAAHKIEFLPGSADRGDFDATSTAIALAPGGQLAALPRPLVDATFERYWREFVARRDGRVGWDAYTPYELRNVGAFVRLGWRSRIPELLDFFMADRRPRGWNQWAEVVGREPRTPRFIGDMPHAWVAAEFIRSLLDAFAFERTSDRSLVLAAGIPVEWMKRPGIAIEKLRTPWGPLSYTLIQDGSRLELSVSGPTSLPPGGLVFPWPFAEEPETLHVDGRRARLEHAEVRITRVPARLVARIARGANVKLD